MPAPSPRNLFKSLSSLLRVPRLSNSTESLPPGDSPRAPSGAPPRAVAPFLPPELLAIIFGHLNAANITPKEYASLALVSRDWLPHARLGLYSSISLTIEDREESANGWLAISQTATDAEIAQHYINCIARQLGLLHRTLRDGPGATELRSLVECVAVRIANTGHVIQIELAIELLVDVLSWTTSLTRLGVNGFSGEQHGLLFAGLNQVVLPALVECAFAGEFQGDKFELQRFLHRQRHSLKALELDLSFYGTAFSDSDAEAGGFEMPQLRSLTLSATHPHDILAQLTANSHDSLTSLDLDSSYNSVLHIEQLRSLRHLTLRGVYPPLFLFASGRPARDKPAITAAATLDSLTIVPRHELMPYADDIKNAGYDEELDWDFDAVVPASVSQLDCSAPLVHPRSFIRWIKTTSRPELIKQLKWCQPRIGWEALGMEDEARALVSLLAQRAIAAVAVGEVVRE